MNQLGAEVSGVVSGPQVPTTRVTAPAPDLEVLPPSYSFGFSTGGTWQEVEGSTDARVGDVLRFTYHLKLPFLQTWQSDYFVDKLKADDRFQVLYYALNEETRTLRVEVQVLKPFSPVILVALAVAALAVGFSIWLTVSSVEKLSTVDVAGVKLNLAPILIGGVLLVLVLGSLGKLRTAERGA